LSANIDKTYDIIKTIDLTYDVITSIFATSNKNNNPKKLKQWNKN